MSATPVKTESSNVAGPSNGHTVDIEYMRSSESVHFHHCQMAALLTRTF
jgi:hypothetical protein